MPTQHRLRKKEDLALRLLEQGKTAREVASDRRIQVHPTTVQRWAKKNLIDLKYPYNGKEDRVADKVDRREIIRLRKKRAPSGRPLFTRIEIAEMCECSESYVKKVLAWGRDEGLL